jgi:hypothetical protein
MAVGDSVGELMLKGFSRPVKTYDVKGLDESRAVR